MKPINILKNFLLWSILDLIVRWGKFELTMGHNFCQMHCKFYLKNMAFYVKKSCVYTPQQNGVVEHKHRHLLEVAWALHFHALLPIKFWGECILTATYLINKIPTQVLKGKSPHEMFFGTKPQYDQLHVFGCLCYARNVDINKTKFDPWEKCCIFVGYPMGDKG